MTFHLYDSTKVLWAGPNTTFLDEIIIMTYDFNVLCLPSFIADCKPKKCGRVVMDSIVTEEEAVHLLG